GCLISFNYKIFAQNLFGKKEKIKKEIVPVEIKYYKRYVLNIIIPCKNQKKGLENLTIPRKKP
ncbi:MAG: hypothetical protein ACTSRG_21865, partial [Candidatus Helarchaeota archaeon]